MTTTPPPILSATSLKDFFREELQAALERLGLKASDDAQAYLVYLLDGYTRLRPEQHAQLGFERAAALMLSDAVFSAGEHRLEAYRQLGDACLYNCGFFEARLTRRHMRPEYYHQVGRTAYTRLGELMSFKPQGQTLGQIFEELASKFEALTYALSQMASSLSAQGRQRALWDQIAQEYPGLASALWPPGFKRC